MLLFVDLDGVLHPSYEGSFVPDELAFCRLPILEEALEGTTVDVVLTSKWREQFGFDSLRARFGRLAPRVCGMTPLLRAENLHPFWGRLSEVRAWLAQHARSEEYWLALDDEPWRYGPEISRVIACQPWVGLDAARGCELRLRLQTVA